ncbi:hypothetical protein [Anaplasma platys]|nr:hypothetical protein [Anaplasma platys]
MKRILTMPVHTSDTPSDEGFEILKTQDFNTAEYWRSRRTESVKQFNDSMRDVDAVHEIHGTLIKDVSSGKNTFSDLFRANIHLNGLPCRTVGRGLYEASTVEERETIFPRQQISRLLGITEQQYRTIDTAEKRRDVFFVLHSLFEKAVNDATSTEQLHVPHMLLLEELTTTLHQGGVTGFPLLKVLQAAHKEEEFISDKPRMDRSTPDSKEITLMCTEPNKVSVHAKCWTPKWLGGGVTTILQYDISFLPREGNLPERILYDGLKVLVAFPGTAEGHTTPHSEAHLLESMNSGVPGGILNIAEESNFKYPDTGFSVVANFSCKAFTVPSMLLPTFHEIPIVPSINPQSALSSAEGDAEAQATERQTPASTNTESAAGNASAPEQLISETMQNVAHSAESVVTDFITDSGHVAASNSSAESQNIAEQERPISAPATQITGTGCVETVHSDEQTPDLEILSQERQSIAAAERTASLESSDPVTESLGQETATSGEEQTNNRTFWDKVREFFSGIGHSIQRFFSSVKNLFCSCATDEQIHEEDYYRLYESSAGKMPETPFNPLDAMLETPTKPQQQLRSEHLATEAANRTGDVPSTTAAYADVSPVGNGSSTLHRG